MVNTANDSSSKSVADNDICKENSVFEDEINLIDYFLVIWKHKWLILACSVLPALIIGISTYLSPRNYTVTYTYDVKGDVRDDIGSWNLNEKNFSVLQSRFYSEDNLNRIINSLQKNHLQEFAQQVKNFKVDALNKFVEFEVSPLFLDISKLEVTDSDQLDKLRDMKAFLLNMTITGKHLDDFGKTTSLIRNNFEEVTPLYMIQEKLSAERRGYNSEMANIESSKFGLELDLNNDTAILARLKKIDVPSVSEKDEKTVLQFDIGGQIEYLPLSYQIHAAESKLVELQAEITTNKANYKYLEDLSVLNEQIISELNAKLSSGQNCTIHHFKTFLMQLIGRVEKQELRDYLASYIKKVENRISISVPVSENPKIDLISRSIVKKSAIVFVVALMLSVFASFLSEGLKKNQT